MPRQHLLGFRGLLEEEVGLTRFRLLSCFSACLVGLRLGVIIYPSSNQVSLPWPSSHPKMGSSVMHSQYVESAV